MKGFQPMQNKKKYAKRARLCMLLFLAVVSLWLCDFQISVLIKRKGQLGVILGQMFPPDVSYSGKIVKPLLETVRMSVGGTAIGAAFAWIAAIFCCQKVTKRGKWTFFLRTVIHLVRAIPVLVIALAASFLLGVGSAAGVTAIALFTFGILSKMTWEQLDCMDFHVMEALCAAGNGRARSFLRTIVPEMMPEFVSNVLYAFEINVRHASILGYVGAGGLGILLNEKIAWREYAKVGMILLFLYGVVLLVEMLNQSLRKKLSSRSVIAGRKKVVIALIFLAALFVGGSEFFEIKAPEKGGAILAGIFSGFLHPDWSLVFNTTKNGVPWLMLETAAMAAGGTAIGAALAVPFSFLASKTTSHPLVCTVARLILAAVRTIPAMIYGLIFIRVTGPGAFAGVMTLAVLSFGMCAKMFSQVLDHADSHLLEAFSGMGCGWFAKIKYALWPGVKKAFFSGAFYRFDVNLRDASVLGLVGAGGIGTPLLFSMNGYLWEMAGAYLIGLIVMVLAADALSSRVRGE